MKCLSSCSDVRNRPLILIISRCCFAEDGTEMYQHVKRTCKACRVLVFAHSTDCFVAFSLLSSLRKLPNIIIMVLWSSRENISRVRAALRNHVFVCEPIHEAASA